MLIADRWQNSPTHLKLTPRCNCFSPQQAVGDDISVPERSSNTPSPVRADTRKQSPSSAPLCLNSTFFLSGDVLWQNSVLKPLHKAVSRRYPLRLEFKEGNACWFEWIKMKLIRNLITKQFANNLKTWGHPILPQHPRNLYLKLGHKKRWAEPASLWDIPS